MPNVLIYTGSNCPYCDNAKRLLSSKGISYTEIHVDQDAAQKDEMIQRSGRRSVPQIFINGQHIGGFDDLANLEKAGKLDILLT